MFRRPFQWTLGTWLGFGVLSFIFLSGADCFPNIFANWGRSQQPSIICNPNSPFSCACETCWTSSDSPFPASEDPQWIAVEFQKCPKLTEISEAEGRKKLSEWLIEECAFVLDCSKFGLTTFTSENIVFGGFECSEGNNKHGILYLSALKNQSEKFETENIIPPSVLGSVVQAREHLFSNLFQADLDSVTTVQKQPSSKESESKRQRFIISETPIMLAAIAFASLLFSFLLTFAGICFCAFFCFSRIQWSRFASTKWIKGTTKKKPKTTKIQKSTFKNSKENDAKSEHELSSLQKSSTEIKQVLKKYSINEGDEKKQLPEKEVLKVV